MGSLMESLRKAFGMSASSQHEPSVEQRMVAERQKRLKLRQEAIDIQVDALREDRRDARAHR